LVPLVDEVHDDAEKSVLVSVIVNLINKRNQ